MLIPIDYENAKVGDVVETSHLISLSCLDRPEKHPRGYKPGTCMFAAFQAKLSRAIERELWDRGKPFVVRARKHTLVILDHEETVDFARAETRRYVRKLIRNNERLLAVDTSQLGDDHAKKHGRAVVVSGAIVAGLLDTPQVRRLAYKRNTPGIESHSV